MKREKWHKGSNGYLVYGKRINGKAVTIRRHRVIMEKHLGRKLRPDEVVHHINGVRDDNRIENLQVMGRGSHQRMHQLGNQHLLGHHHSKETRKKMRGSALKMLPEKRKKITERSRRVHLGRKHSEETKEKISKHQQGEKGNNARLTDAQVLEIRKRYSGNESPSYASLAREYRVSWPTIRNIVLRKSWKHL
jgi:hypothetical protein